MKSLMNRRGRVQIPEMSAKQTRDALEILLRESCESGAKILHQELTPITISNISTAVSLELNELDKNHQRRCEIGL
jgi:hypothetical protein